MARVGEDEFAVLAPASVKRSAGRRLSAPPWSSLLGVARHGVIPDPVHRRQLAADGGAGGAGCGRNL